MRFIDTYVKKFISEKEYENMLVKAEEVHKKISNRTCLGNNMMKWFDLDSELKELKEHAEKINSSSDVVLVIGIGGSYLGAFSAIKFLRRVNESKVVFTGFCLDPEYLRDVLNSCEGKKVHVIVISKSGNTIEMRATLQIILSYMRRRYGSDLKDKFTAVTGLSGFLRSFAKENEWKIFDISEEFCGRYSVLSNVGLLPILISGADAEKMFEGARYAKEKFNNVENDCYRYTIIRSILSSKLNLSVELFGMFSLRLDSFAEWLKQLFAESEGKERRGIFPSSSLFSTDLHSIGQFVQEGKRILFETILLCKNNDIDIQLKNDIEPKLNFDSLNSMNKKVMEAILFAHNGGDVPINVIEFEEYSEFELGCLFFFFELSCWISCNLMNIDPSTQPGVQKYKEILY